MPPWWDKQAPLSEESDSPSYDDGGSGLLDACTMRFADRGWQLRCDANHAVWIESADSSYSVGIAQWMIDRRPVEKILDYVEAKMKDAEARAQAIALLPDAPLVKANPPSGATSGTPRERRTSRPSLRASQ